MSMTSDDWRPIANEASTASRAKKAAGGRKDSNSTSTAFSRDARVLCAGSDISTAISDGSTRSRSLFCFLFVGVLRNMKATTAVVAAARNAAPLKQQHPRKQH